MNANRQPQIGDVYLMRFGGSGSEQSGWRPGIVFQNNIGNAYSPNIIALPLTSQIKKANQPTHVILPAKETGLRKDSMVLCENPEIGLVIISPLSRQSIWRKLPQPIFWRRQQ